MSLLTCLILCQLFMTPGKYQDRPLIYTKILAVEAKEEHTAMHNHNRTYLSNKTELSVG